MTLTKPYVRTQVAGQEEGTVDGKPRDLACFLQFAVKLSGHDARRVWFKSITENFLKALARDHVLRPSIRGEAVPQRSPRDLRHVHQNPPVDHLHRVARDPLL